MPKQNGNFFTAEELLERIAYLHPGLIDGEEDNCSGADVVDSLGQLFSNYEKLNELILKAKEAREGE